MAMAYVLCARGVGKRARERGERQSLERAHELVHERGTRARLTYVKRRRQPTARRRGREAPGSEAEGREEAASRASAQDKRKR
jgi:hypothetical protein